MAETTLARARPAAGRAPARALQMRCACGAKSGAAGRCDACEERRRREAQRAAAPGAGLGLAAAVPDGPGRPLPDATRRFFEHRFGHAFGDVRVHDGDRAAAAARAAGALAFTSGRDIVFGGARFDPHGRSGMRLLAHELTHVVQQRAGLAAARTSASDDPAEHEAERNAERLHTREPLRFDARAPALARQPTPAAAPAEVGPCSDDQREALDPVLALALEQLAGARRRLDAFIAAPGDAAHAGTQAALSAHFHGHAPALPARVRHVLDAAHGNLAARRNDPAGLACGTAANRRCASFDAVADGDSVMVCPSFFGSARQGQATLLIHEIVHALPDTDDDTHVPDRAYANDRLLPALTAEESVNNAESYALFVRELATGTAARGTPPADEIEDCSDATRAAIRRALGLGQRWTSIAAMAAASRTDRALFTTHLGDAEPATYAAADRLYATMKRRLQSPIEVHCDERAASACSAEQRAYMQPAVGRAGAGARIGAAIGGGLGLIGGIVGGLMAAPVIGTGLALLLGAGITALGALLGAGLGGLIGLAASSDASAHVCPDWISLPDDKARAESLLSAVYQTYGNVSAAQALRHAALARALHDDFPGDAPAIRAPAPARAAP